MSPDALLPWDLRDLEALLRLQPLGPTTFRSRRASSNVRGTVFGGQLLGHALMAASMTAPPGREVSAMQFMFLQSAVPDRPIDFEVRPLQDGKRFASRHVSGSQAGATAEAPRRVVLDAQVTFATPLAGPAHATPTRAAQGDPASLPRVEDVPSETSEAILRTVGYPFESPTLDVRVEDPLHRMGLGATIAELRFWLRTREALADDPILQAAAFAYLSDWWLNFATVGIHVQQLDRDGVRMHVASLNHAIWFHRPLRADRWLHFDVRSPCAGRGRGLSIAAVHDAEGQLVASVTQENLMTPIGD